jgi:TonB-dependent SusC/RagA subfamily outer membrane receptor
MKLICLVLALVLISPAVLPQEKVLSGKITTFETIPVVNASILVKSSGVKYYSDTAGMFSAKCLDADKLVISAAGFANRKVNVRKETFFAIVNMELLPKQDSKDVAVGYGHVKDKDKLYAMAGMNESGINFSRYKDVYEILSTNFAGVQVINGEVIIRNANSFESTKPALLIVDGREVSAASLAALSTADISQINVLKDSSASVYGVRGANGVVIIETKRGGKNQMPDPSLN